VSPLSPNNSLKASFNGVETSVTIFPRSIAFNAQNYDRGSTANVLVTDNNANTNPSTKQSVDITISSKEGGNSIPFTLAETGPDSGKFGGVGEMTLLFSDGNDKFPDKGTLTVTVEIPAATKVPAPDPTILDVGTVEVTSNTSDTVGFVMTVTEDAVDSNIYTAQLTLTTGSTDASTNSIKVSGGDILTVKSGEFSTNAVIVPSNPLIGLLPVEVTETTPDTITASYLDVTDEEIVKFAEGEGGGGGGGIVRPSLVVNVVAGLSLFGGGGSSGGPPSISSSSFAIFGAASEGSFVQQSADFDSSIIGKQSLTPKSGVVSDSEASKKDSSKSVTFKKNQKVVLDFDIFETRGDLKHATLYMNEGEITGYLEEYTYIRWDDKGVTIHDEKGIFNEADIEIIENEDRSLTLRFTMAFGSEVDESDVMLKVWNYKRQGANIVYEDAFKVTDAADESISESLFSDIISEASQEPKPQEIPDIIVQSEPKDKSIPAWIKTSANWWSENQINDKDFVLGLEYLVKEEIIQIPKIQVNTDKSQNIPEWIKSTAGWWSEGGITDDEFKNAVQWLIEKGVMTV